LVAPGFIEIIIGVYLKNKKAHIRQRLWAAKIIRYASLTHATSNGPDKKIKSEKGRLVPVYGWDMINK